jgi:hypothetical protein
VSKKDAKSRNLLPEVKAIGFDSCLLLSVAYAEYAALKQGFRPEASLHEHV